VLPSHGAVGVHAHLGDLLAAGAEDVVAGGLEAVDAGIAGPGGDASLGHARAVGHLRWGQRPSARSAICIAEAAGHGGHIEDGGAGHGANAPLAVVEILVNAVVIEIARRAHDGISIAPVKQKPIEVRGLPGPQLRGIPFGRLRVGFRLRSVQAQGHPQRGLKNKSLGPRAPANLLVARVQITSCNLHELGSTVASLGCLSNPSLLGTLEPTRLFNQPTSKPASVATMIRTQLALRLFQVASWHHSPTKTLLCQV